jgi:hypothetical protein
LSLTTLAEVCSHNHDYEFLVGKYFLCYWLEFIFNCVNINVVL